MNPNSENTFKALKKSSKIFEYLENPNLQKLILNEKLVDIDLVKLEISLKFLRQIIVRGVNIQSYDERLRGWTGFQDEWFFKEFQALMDEALETRKSKTRSLFKSFLELPAIKFLKIKGLKATATTLLNNEIPKLEEKYNSIENGKQEEFLKEIPQLFEKVEKQVEKLLTFPDQIQLEARKTINDIKNNFETLAKIAGLILGLFEVLIRFPRNLKFYFHNTLSALQFFFPRKNYNISKIQEHRIINYLNNPKFYYLYSSFKSIFQNWLFKEFRDLRIHKAHDEINVVQDELNQKYYKICVGDSLRRYTLAELEEIKEKTGIFLQNLKMLVAKSYFRGNLNFTNYILKSI